ncbi:hypothetical protein VPHD292_0026 [Vibrio phage D292]
MTNPLTPQQIYDANNANYFQNTFGGMFDKLGTSAANVLGMNTYYQDTAKNIGTQFSTMFGDGSFNDPSKPEFWKASTPAQPQQMLPQMNPAVFAPSTPAQTPVVSPAVTPATMSTPQPVPAQVQQTPAITPIPAPATALPDTNPMGDATWGQPTSVGSVTAVPESSMFAPYTGASTVDSGNVSSQSVWDMFGLSDMTSKDLWTGAAGATQLGLGAYGMFKGLDQMDTRLDQGQQALDLSRDEYEENLRHRQAIVSQNKGA